MKASTVPSIIASSSSHPARVNKTTRVKRPALARKKRRERLKRRRKNIRLAQNKIRKVRSRINREILRSMINKVKSRGT